MKILQPITRLFLFVYVMKVRDLTISEKLEAPFVPVGQPNFVAIIIHGLNRNRRAEETPRSPYTCYR